MIDPPSGWKYGFPKEYTKKEGQTPGDWLIENGYPEEEILSMGDQFYCRHWTQKIEE